MPLHEKVRKMFINRDADYLNISDDGILEHFIVEK
jgi:hypothetical protein